MRKFHSVIITEEEEEANANQTITSHTQNLLMANLTESTI